MDATWANAVPLVTLLGVVFGAGIVVAEVRSTRRDFREHKRDTQKALDDIKREVADSARDQGRRIGNLEAEQRATAKADDVRRELGERRDVEPK